MKRLRANTDPLRLALLVSLGLGGCSADALDSNHRERGSTVMPPLPTGVGGGMTTVPPVLGACEGAVPFLPHAVEAGLVECDNGLVHRPAVVACPDLSKDDLVGPDAGPPSAALAAPPPSDTQCTTHADCKDTPFGMCEGPGGAPFATCKSGCLEDTDCQANEVCVCGDPYGTCEAADCKSDADCAGDALCLRGYAGQPTCDNDHRFFCQSVEDKCFTSADCSGDYCTAESGHFECKAQPGYSCGRPFLVHGGQRQALAEGNAAWCTDTVSVASTTSSAVDDTLRPHLAEAWTRLGLMEHASIAAFARFTLQLLQLGAPPALVEDSGRAMNDETRHAQLCFTLASQYAGEPMGPGPLNISGALDTSSLLEIVLTTIEEGCIGETIAALEAAEGAEHAQDAAVRAVLEQIRVDELRHSELAWRFVSWAVKSGDRALHTAVGAAFEQLETEAKTGAPGAVTPLDGQLLTCGIVGPSVARQLRIQALRNVVLPCARALLNSTSRVEGQRGLRCI